jgi:hypothetical protein
MAYRFHRGSHVKDYRLALIEKFTSATPFGGWCNGWLDLLHA